ncbi:MAG: hypothetical protein LBQ94_06700 [Treponema sp.]|nr:hypothetical protein [Treponema sp.]
MKNFRFFSLLLVVVLTAFSCSSEGELQDILGLNSETKSPVFLDCRPVSPTEVMFNFSHPVTVVSVVFEPSLEIDSVEDGSEVKVTFTGKIEAGMKITADIIVEDSKKDTLNVIVPFRARNDRMPALVFNELRTEYSKPKAEFVEFLARESGNLGAMRLFIAGHSISEPVYEFPPAEVAAGEYIVFHLRTLEDGCVDETGSNLALSGGTDAHNTARDFWLPNTSEMLRKTDALWLMDQDDRIIDAVIFSENPGSSWSNNKVAEAAKLLGAKKAWLPLSKGDDGRDNWVPSPDDVVTSKGTTTSKTICRDDSLPAEPRAGNWYITATNGLTPGEKNKTSNDGAQQNSGSGNPTPAPVVTPPAVVTPPVVETPDFVGYHAVSSTVIVFEFSLPVRLNSINFDDPSLIYTSKAEGRELRITFTEPLDEGMLFTADIQLKDSSGKNHNQTIPFRARNDRMPAIIFNELRTENTKPKAEFVEFYTTGSGNLGALRLFIAGYSLTKPVYEFPPVEVSSGDYIVLHLRATEDGCIDETGSDLTLSGGTDARNNARDFWIQGNSKILHKTDALWLMDQDDRIIDAVLLWENSNEWGKYNSAEAAEFLGQKGAWLPSADPVNAVKSSGTTNTRTICRDQAIPHNPRADNWYITANSGVTLGEQNNPKRYAP